MAVPKPTLKLRISPKPKTPAIFWRRCAKLLAAAGSGILIVFLVVSLNQGHQGFLWLLGLVGIGLGAALLDKNIIRQQGMEMELEEANRTLEGLMEAAPWAVVGLDPQGCVSWWSPAATRIFGWQASQVVGQPPPFLSEEMLPEFRELYARGLQGERVRGVAVCHHRNGVDLDISFSMSPLYGPEDQLKGVVAVLEDITERQNTEKELFRVNEQLKSWVFEFSRRNRDITLLNQMGDLLQTCKTVEEAFACAGRFIPRIFSRESGVLFRCHSEKNILVAVYRWGEQAPGAEQFFPDECQALTARQDHVIQHPGSGFLCGHLTGVSHSYMCIPMIAQGETLGLILLHKDLPEGATGEILSESKRRLAITAAKQIALSLANIKLRNSLREQAIRDPLTGLFNRRYLEEMLERELFRVQRQRRPLSIIMLDLDLFKHINTAFGHEGGDALIQAVGDFLRSHFRREDIACRYGGEEFIVILPETSLETSVARAEQMRQGVQELQVEYRGRSLGPVTASLGVAAFPDHGAAGEALIRAADAALYRAKEEGRNRVVIAE